MSYELIMLVAFAIYIPLDIMRRRNALALAEAKRRHPAGKGR